MTDTLYIRDDASLAQLVDRIRGIDEIAIDTEFLRERTYYPKLCLLQLATPGLLALVDPLAVADLDALWDVLCGGPTIVLHAGGQDLEIVQRLAGRLPAEVYDTQLAGAFLGLGDSIGYSKLVEAMVGHSPGRSEAYTDWSRRPLSADQQKYALDDVRYLLSIADQQRERLTELRRLAWFEEESAKVQAGVCHSPEPSDQWRRVKGARGLSGKALAVLQAATAWREEEAVRRDIPRQRVVPDRVLVEVARRAPTTADTVSKMRGLHPGEASRSAAVIAARVSAAIEQPRELWPEWPERRPLADDPSVDAAASLLDAVVRSRALTTELAPRLLATRADLVLLVRLALRDEADSRPDFELLNGWRREAIGEELVALLRGQTSVRVHLRNGSLTVDVS